MIRIHLAGVLGEGKRYVARARGSPDGERSGTTAAGLVARSGRLEKRFR
jgi:hypothetical protein